MGTELGPRVVRRDLRASAAAHRGRGRYPLPATSAAVLGQPPEQPLVPRPWAIPALADEHPTPERPRLRLIVS